MSIEIPLTENCYFCGRWNPGEEHDIKRNESFSEGHFNVPAGIDGTCLASNFQPNRVSISGRKKFRPNHQTSSQSVCHVTIYDNTAFNPHGAIDFEKYKTHIAESARKLDTHD